MPVMTERRRAEILEHLAIIKGQLGYVRESTRTGSEPGDAAMLYPMILWLAPMLEEVIQEHVVGLPARSREEEAPKLSLVDRLRGMAGGAFGMSKPSTTAPELPSSTLPTVKPFGPPPTPPKVPLVVLFYWFVAVPSLIALAGLLWRWLHAAGIVR